MNKPDFIGVGTERAGTSWVFSMIAHHPQSWVPPLKELHFLDAIDPNVPCHKPRYKWQLTGRFKHKLAAFMKFPYRPEFYKNSFFKYLLWDYYFFCKPVSFDWYRNLFKDTFTKGRIAGEYTPAYCNVAPVYIEKLLSLNPKMKFILILRDPVQQLRSSLIQNFVMIEGRDFQSVSEEEMMVWLSSSFAKHKSNLKDIVLKWQSHVPKDQLFLGAYEDIKNNPVTMIKNIYSFLGLDINFQPDDKFYKNKINNLTKPNYIIPDSIQNYIKDSVKKDINFIHHHDPQLTKYWSTT